MHLFNWDEDHRQDCVVKGYQAWEFCAQVFFIIINPIWLGDFANDKKFLLHAEHAPNQKASYATLVPYVSFQLIFAHLLL